MKTFHKVCPAKLDVGGITRALRVDKDRQGFIMRFSWCSFSVTCFSFEFHESPKLLKVALLLDLGELEPGSYRLPRDCCVVHFEHQKQLSDLKVWWGNTLQYFAVVWIATMLLWQKAPKKWKNLEPS